MWNRVRKAIKELDPVRIENKIEKGTPDVWYTEGAIELKWQRKLPKRGGVLRLDHDMTLEQRIWAIRRQKAGGKVFLLLKAGKFFILLKGYIAAEYIGKLSLIELQEKAEKVWVNKLVDHELREILTRN